MNKHGVSRWFTEADVKHFKSGALGTITNITKSMANSKKEIPHWCMSNVFFVATEQFSKMNIFPRYFSRILLIDLELLT